MAGQHFIHNHYVPEWYQRRFLPAGQATFYYLDLHPETVVSHGHTYKRREMLRRGPPSCFAKDDLYTTRWGGLKNTDIEQYFFGEIDQKGRNALEYFSDFDIKEGLHEAFEALVRYMSVQKLRTPKGLGFISETFKIKDRNQVLMILQQFQVLYGAIWTEAIWQIADASESKTKFIISDHPVTVYNRGCFPGSAHCRNFNDPDIRMTGTHTLFPLSLDKILILTNLSWVRNPYQKETDFRPNPRFFHQAIFNAMSIQQGRKLTEEEVRQINYITKRRSLRWVASSEKDWLYPEQFMPSTHWSKFGNDYLLMPEPRDIHMGGEIFFGWDNGHSEAFSEYGHRPWQPDYNDNARFAKESAALKRFQGEFALMQGKDHRGWSHEFGNKGPRSDSEEYYEYVIANAPKKNRRPKL